MLAAVAILLGALLIARSLSPEPLAVSGSAQQVSLILDPGHGGLDGGAIAYDGTKESDLNLSIALKLRDLAAFYGCETVMTREDDSPAPTPRLQRA